MFNPPPTQHPGQGTLGSRRAPRGSRLPMDPSRLWPLKHFLRQLLNQGEPPGWGPFAPARPKPPKRHRRRREVWGARPGPGPRGRGKAPHRPLMMYGGWWGSSAGWARRRVRRTGPGRLTRAKRVQAAGQKGPGRTAWAPYRAKNSSVWSGCAAPSPAKRACSGLEGYILLVCRAVSRQALLQQT